MPRSRRNSPPNCVQHLINRGNDRQCLYDSPEEFEEFLDLMRWAKGQCPIRIIAYVLMANHWHFVVWPEEKDSVSKFAHRLCTIHSIRRRRVTNTIGEGHIGASPEAGLSHGAVMWRIEQGTGQFAGATGIITSNFTLSEQGEVTDCHFGVIWLA